jgi:hypothetical protein
LSPRIPSSKYYHRYHHILLLSRHIHSTLHSISADLTLCPQCSCFIERCYQWHKLYQYTMDRERSWPRTNRYPDICLGLRTKNKKSQDSQSGLRVEAGAPGKKQSIHVP